MELYDSSADPLLTWVKGGEGGGDFGTQQSHLRQTSEAVRQVRYISSTEVAGPAWRWERLFLAALPGFRGEAGRWLGLGSVLVGLPEDLPELEENSETVWMPSTAYPSARSTSILTFHEG